jgi:hypothetical protein
MQLTIFDALLDDSRAGLSGKTCQASSQQKTTPSAPSWADWSGVTPPSFRATDGQTQVWLMDPAAAPHGGSWTPSTSDWLSDGSGSSCSLSSILEVGPHLTRYYLSSKACAGILRRAEKRGKDLPPQLAHALKAVADSEQTQSLMAR